MTATFQTFARDFKDFVDPLLRHAGTDDQLPVLTCVKLQGIGGTVVGMSTDRYRLAFHRFSATNYEGDADWSLLIPVASIKRLLAVFGPKRGHNPLLVITVDADTVTITDYELTMTVKQMAGSYPDFLPILRELDKAEASDLKTTFGVNAKFLADIAAASGRDNTTVVRAPAKAVGVRKPMVFQLSDNLLILLMPRAVYGPDSRTPVDPTLDLAPWIDLLGGAS